MHFGLSWDASSFLVLCGCARNGLCEDVFSELDTSGDGCVEWDEFKRVLKDDLLKAVEADSSLMLTSTVWQRLLSVQCIAEIMQSSTGPKIYECGCFLSMKCLRALGARKSIESRSCHPDSHRIWNGSVKQALNRCLG
eukprot:5170881-Amphidinium_carterae.1